MKFIRNIFIFVGIIIVLIGALVAVTFDSSGSEMLPTHLYTDEYDSSEMIFKELNESFDDVENNTTTDLLVEVDEDVLNRFIYEKILTVNENYAPGPDCETDGECFVVASNAESEQGSVKTHMVGVYATFFDGDSEDDPGRLVFNIYFEVDFNGFFTYKTVLEAHFLFDDDTENNQYFLEFDKLQMGNIRVPKSMFSWVIKQAEKSGAVDVDDLSGDLPIGELDINELSYTVDKDEILTHLGESNEESSYNQLTQELLSISFDRNLVLLELENGKFALEVQVSQFRNVDIDKTEMPMYLYDLHDQEIVDDDIVYGEYNSELFDSTSYLQDVFTQFLFSGALSPSGDKQEFEIDEETFNKLVYSNANGFTDTRKVQTVQISETETKDIELGLKSIWFEFVKGEGEIKDSVYAHALFRIAGIDSLLVIRADVTYVDVTVEGKTVTEMHCIFNEITFGKDDAETSGQYIQISDLSVFKKVFSDIGDVQFGEFNQNGDLIINPLKLTKLLTSGIQGNSINVVSVGLIDDALTLEIEAPDHQALLDSFQDALTGVLGSDDVVTDLLLALEPEAGSVEEVVYDAIVDIQGDLDSGTEISPEQISSLLDGFEDMNSESQTDFLDTFSTLMGESGDGSILTDFESIFGAFVDE